MRILIGILHTIENEFPQCIEAIKNQTYQNFDYFVVENIPNKEAHDTLYRRFMDSADNYELFIKVDADMVLSRTTFFEEVATKMKENTATDDLEIAVHDFFTDRLIYGLHVFRNTMTWDTENNESIFVDRTGQQKVHVHDDKELAPAAFHCPNPSPFQSFHFGLHKATKVMQIDNPRLYAPASAFHWSNIQELLNNYYKTEKPILRYAILGAYWAIKHKATSKEVNYNSEKSSKAYQYISQLNELRFNQVFSKAIHFFSYRRKNLLYEWIIFRSKWTEMSRIKRFIYFIFKHLLFNPKQCMPL